MHRDIARLLVLLAVVRVLTVVACPAPAPQRRITHREADREFQRHVYQRKPTIPRREAAKCNNRDHDQTLNPLASNRPLDSPPQRISNQTSAGVPAVSASRAPEPSVCAPSQPETIQTAQTTATGPPARRCRTVPAAPDAPSPLSPPLGQRRAARSGGRRPQRRGARGRRGRGGGRRLESTLPLTGQLSGTGLHIGALNIQSLKPKLLELTDAITRYDYDVLLLSETWLRPSTPNRLLVIPGYAISRADRPDGRGYGGVAIVTKAGITSMALKLPNSKCPGSLLESQWAQLKLPKNRQLIVGSLYRPPRHSVAALRADFADLETQLQQIFINHPKVPLVICGDLNCDML